MTELLKSVSYVGSLPMIEILQSLFQEVLDLKKEIKILANVVLNGRNINSDQFSHQSTDVVGKECRCTDNNKNIDSLHEQNVIQLVRVVSNERSMNYGSEKPKVEASHVLSSDTCKSAHEDVSPVQVEISKLEEILPMNLHEKNVNKLVKEASAEGSMDFSLEDPNIKACHVISSNSFIIADEDVTQIKSGVVKLEKILPINSFSSKEYHWNIASNSSVQSVDIPKCVYADALVSSDTDPKYLESIPELNTEETSSLFTEEKNEKPANFSNKDFYVATKVLQRSDGYFSADETPKEKVVNNEAGKNSIKAAQSTKLCRSLQCAQALTVLTEKDDNEAMNNYCTPMGKTDRLCMVGKGVCASENSITCPLCVKSFSSKESLKLRMREHTGEKPYVCGVCNMSFSQTCHLKMHMVIHPGKKRYVCFVCHKAFSVIGNLKNHIAVHTGEYPYVCSACGKAFKQYAHSEDHMKIHTDEKPHVCSVCNKAFKQSAQLEDHMRIHTGEKPYPCTVCSKAFSRKSNLKCHMVIHTGEKPFVCSVCRKGFSQKSKLKRHMTVHRVRVHTYIQRWATKFRKIAPKPQAHLPNSDCRTSAIATSQFCSSEIKLAYA